MNLVVRCGLIFVAALSAAAVEPLRIDLTTPAPPALSGHLGLGQTNAPGGHTLWADSCCLYRDGQPWIPVMGEFHFTRYPEQEWRSALLKMKSGGIDIVATYVFWIHHEEEQGKFDWSGRRSLRDFLKVCRDLDLLAVVRLGPWSHGEVRHGGFPDWVENASFWPDKQPFKNRTTHPEFMRLVEPLYRQIAAQMQGLLWKDGGPVVGVQHDNECWNLPYLLALKQLARDCAIDVPFYTMTGWNAVPIPDEGLLPLFGGYSDGFWSNDKLPYRKAFHFTPIRDDGDMGAINGRLVNTRPERNAKIQRFPYFCCEIGGGMPSSYENRIHVTPADVATLALIKLGEGNNLPGYYMYHGGFNPDGKLSTLNETKATGYPNDLPFKDYDFEAPLGAAGQVREHFFLLRQQHLFLQNFGRRLASMPAFFPELQPQSLDDVTTVRWNARSDGQSGFIFFNNHQRYQQLPAKEGVQFALKIAGDTLLVPRKPVTLPAGSFGLWAFNLDCDGVRLQYATAQPLCSLAHDGDSWFFFAALPGIEPEFAIVETNGKTVMRRPKTGTAVAFREKSVAGHHVNFIVLDSTQACRLGRFRLGAAERVVLSPNAIVQENAGVLALEAIAPALPSIAVFPPVEQAVVDGRKLKTTREGVFQELSLPDTAPLVLKVETASIAEAKAIEEPLNAMEESAWQNAASWQVRTPQPVSVREGLLRIEYVGDVARVYAAGKLVLDHFYNGQPFDLALWRLTPAELANLEIRILPLHAERAARLPSDMRPDFAGKPSLAALSAVNVFERKQVRIFLAQ